MNAVSNFPLNAHGERKATVITVGLALVASATR
jgi:hypothetical protein